MCTNLHKNRSHTFLSVVLMRIDSTVVKSHSKNNFLLSLCVVTLIPPKCLTYHLTDALPSQFEDACTCTESTDLWWAPCPDIWLMAWYKWVQEALMTGLCISLRKDEWKLTGKYRVGTVSAEFINIVYGEFKCAVVLKDYNNYRRFKTTVFSSMQMYVWV